MSDSSNPPDRRSDFTTRIRPEIALLHHRLRRLGVRESDLDDVVHDVLVQVWLQWDAYDPARPLRPWLTAFSIRAASNYRQKAVNRRPHVPFDDDPSDLAELAEAVLARREERDLLLLALDELPDEQREVVVFVDLEEYSVPDAAALLSVPLNTAYTRLRLGRAALERLVARHLRGRRSR